MIRIKNFVINNSYFNLNDEEENYLQFSSRRYGVINENGNSPGEQDINEAMRMIDLIKNNFKDIIANFSYCDEWAYLNVKG